MLVTNLQIEGIQYKKEGSYKPNTSTIWS